MAVQSFTLSEGTSRSQTKTITIPNLKSINSISVNTGSVSVSSTNGDTVTLSLSGGGYTRRVQTGGSYTSADSKSVSEKREFSSTLSYNCQVNPSGGYHFVGLSSNSYPSAPSTVSYSKDGYSGTLSAVGAPSNNGVGREGDACSGIGQGAQFIATISRSYYGTVTRPESDTRTYTYYYQYIVTVDYVDNSKPTVEIKNSADSVLLKEQVIQKRDKNNFLFKIKANDVDTSDTLQYSILFNNAERTTWTSIVKNTDVNHTIPHSAMLTGNNVVVVKVKDNNGGEVSATFTIRTIAPNSYCQADVYTLTTALGYSVAGASSLQTLKPSGYNKTTLSLAELVNHLT